MRALSAGELLTVWEHGASQRPSQRALSLLAVACADEAPPDQLARLSLGQRDQRLLNLRERTFGPHLAAISACPACSELLEFTVNAADIQIAAPEPAETIHLAHAGYDLQFRLPDSLDLATVDPSADPQTNSQHLLRRCITTARRAGAEIPAEDLPPEVVAAVSERMAQADPQADVQLDLSCPQCEHRWHTPFDIVSFFWSEINALALRLLQDVHALASAYGWSEADILSMTPTRRQAYLELIHQ
jgi:T4 bacteriophage base plate protein